MELRLLTWLRPNAFRAAKVSRLALLFLAAAAIVLMLRMSADDLSRENEIDSGNGNERRPGAVSGRAVDAPSTSTKPSKKRPKVEDENDQVFVRFQCCCTFFLNNIF
jgi:hypothetical protein